VQALPLAAYFLFLEAAVGGVIALFLVHLRGEVSRGFVLFTGWSLWLAAALGAWLRAGFPPPIAPDLEPVRAGWYAAERSLGLAFVALLALFLVLLHLRRAGWHARLAPAVPLAGLGALWCAALVEPTDQLFGLGAPLAVVAGALALGCALTGLSLGHWYLVAPTLSVKPLILVTLLGLGAIGAQASLLPPLLLATDPAAVRGLLGEHGLFFAVRVLFGLVVPLATLVLVWRTARIRSLDSATGLLYVVATMVLTGEIAARSLQFLAGVAT
jgi:hypothetical protein